MSMTSLMIKETQLPHFFGRERKKKMKTGGTMPSQVQWVEVRFNTKDKGGASSHCWVGESSAPPEASFNTTWLGGTGG